MQPRGVHPKAPLDICASLPQFSPSAISVTSAVFPRTTSTPGQTISPQNTNGQEEMEKP